MNRKVWVKNFKFHWHVANMLRRWSDRELAKGNFDAAREHHAASLSSRAMALEAASYVPSF